MYSKAMFAKQFKELIDKRGLTQRAVAERINTTETFWSVPICPLQAAHRPTSTS